MNGKDEPNGCWSGSNICGRRLALSRAVIRVYASRFGDRSAPKANIFLRGNKMNKISLAGACALLVVAAPLPSAAAPPSQGTCSGGVLSPGVYDGLTVT